MVARYSPTPTSVDREAHTLSVLLTAALARLDARGIGRPKLEETSAGSCYMVDARTAAGVR